MGWETHTLLAQLARNEGVSQGEVIAYLVRRHAHGQGVLGRKYDEAQNRYAERLRKKAEKRPKRRLFAEFDLWRNGKKPGHTTPSGHPCNWNTSGCGPRKP